LERGFAVGGYRKHERKEQKCYTTNFPKPTNELDITNLKREMESKEKPKKNAKGKHNHNLLAL